MNQEVRRVQGIVRSHTEVEAEAAHERLVADDDGDGGDHGEDQRPHRPQLELSPPTPISAAQRRRRTNDQANDRTQKITDFPITPPRAPATKLKTAHLDQRNYHGARQAHEQTNKQKNGSRHGETYRLGLVLVQETQADLGEGAAMAGRSGHRSAAVARAPRWVRESGDRG
jgi:hypothetical protein